MKTYKIAWIYSTMIEERESDEKAYLEKRVYERIAQPVPCLLTVDIENDEGIWVDTVIKMTFTCKPEELKKTVNKIIEAQSTIETYTVMDEMGEVLFTEEDKNN